MVQLITFLLIAAALLILVLQNLGPALSLVVLGNPTVALPLSLWLLGAIATGVILTLIIYQLVPTKRAYRPMGQRLSDPTPEPTNRFVDAPDAPNQYEPQSTDNRQNPYDNDWETFKAPEQWDDWGQQSGRGQQSGWGQQSGRTSGYTADQTYREAPRPSDAVDDTVRDIETGWGDDDYEASARYASRQDAGPDMGWDEQGNYRSDSPSPRTYEEGWLYGSDDEPPVSSEPEEPPQSEDSEDVYDANYRVIIPPYDPNDKDG